MTRPIKRIGLNTGGGDAPGLNAVIRAVVLSGLGQGWEVCGIRKGYGGLFEDDGVVPLDAQAVRGLTHLGGTILGTTNRGNPFEWPVKRSDGTVEVVDRSDEVLDALRRHQLDALIAIGGDGSLRIAHELAQKGLPVVGVPKTIDNDLAATQVTFGFHTAVQTASDAIDKLHSTAESHERVMVVEVMGRHTGWIALHSGVSADGRRDPDPRDPLRHREGLRQGPRARPRRPEVRDRRRRRGRRAQGRERGLRRGGRARTRRALRRDRRTTRPRDR